MVQLLLRGGGKELSRSPWVGGKAAGGTGGCRPWWGKAARPCWAPAASPKQCRPPQETCVSADFVSALLLQPTRGATGILCHERGAADMTALRKTPGVNAPCAG